MTDKADCASLRGGKASGTWFDKWQTASAERDAARAEIARLTAARTLVGPIEDDMLVSLLRAGNASPDAQNDAANWLCRLYGEPERLIAKLTEAGAPEGDELKCVFGTPDCGPIVMIDNSGEPWCQKCKDAEDALRAACEHDWVGTPGECTKCGTFREDLVPPVDAAQGVPGQRVEISDARLRYIINDAWKPSEQTRICEMLLEARAALSHSAVTAALAVSEAAANDKMGRWLSAALDDPNVCAEMKADIRNWFDACPKDDSPPTPCARISDDVLLAFFCLILLSPCQRSTK